MHLSIHPFAKPLVLCRVAEEPIPASWPAGQMANPSQLEISPNIIYALLLLKQLYHVSSRLSRRSLPHGGPLPPNASRHLTLSMSCLPIQILGFCKGKLNPIQAITITKIVSCRMCFSCGPSLTSNCMCYN